MKAGRIGSLVRLAAATPGQLRRPIGPEEAIARLREQLAAREENFLAVARRFIYDHPRSPYRALLLDAGWSYDDLERSVRHAGLEETLALLRDARVRVSLEEFKRQAPIVRGKLRLEPAESDFDAPLGAGGMSGTTSGSRAAPTRVIYSWPFIAEEASHELLLILEHDLHDAPSALWYPVPPGVAGIHNLLILLRLGRAPERWFSQTDPAAGSATMLDRLSLGTLRTGAWLVGRRTPAPEFADPARGGKVIDWLARMTANGRPAAIRGFGSAIVRMAHEATARKARLDGVTLFSGGEPLTDLRRKFIEATGARVHPRFVITEAGLTAASCRRRKATDEMHLYSSRLAVIPGEEDGEGRTRLLVTTISPHTGKVLLNTELGDAGRLSRRACDCHFGRLGFDRFVRDVRSLDRLTLEGMTVGTSAVAATLDALLEPLATAPDLWQFRTGVDERGVVRLELVIDPAIGTIDETRFLDGFYARLATAAPGLGVAAEVWSRAGTVRVVRESPRMSAGAKLTARAGSPVPTTTR